MQSLGLIALLVFMIIFAAALPLISCLIHKHYCGNSDRRRRQKLRPKSTTHIRQIKRVEVSSGRSRNQIFPEEPVEVSSAQWATKQPTSSAVDKEQDPDIIEVIEDDFSN